MTGRKCVELLGLLIGWYIIADILHGLHIGAIASVLSVLSLLALFWIYANEHLCCIIRSKKAHPGVEAKRKWLSERLKEGHVFRKLNEKATVFIEYAPL